MGQDNTKCGCCSPNDDNKESVQFEQEDESDTPQLVISKSPIEKTSDVYSIKDLKQFAENRANSISSNTQNPNGNGNALQNNQLLKGPSLQSGILKGGVQFTLNPQDTISRQSSKKDVPSVSFFTLKSKSNYKPFSSNNNQKPLTKAEAVIIIQGYYRGFIYRNNYPKIRKELVSHLNKMLKDLYRAYLTDNLKKQEEKMGIAHNENTWQNLFTMKKADNIMFLEPKKHKKSSSIIKATHNGLVLYTKLLVDKEKENFYIGEVNMLNEKHGRGVMYTSQGKKYEGDWQNDYFTGNGIFIDSEGALYEGVFTKGLLNGIGTKTMLDNNTYTGNFVNSIRNGKGKEETVEHIYEGDFFHDLKNGKGKLMYKNVADCYEGDFADNMINGTGKYLWANGESYSGTYLNSQMHGKGVYKWPDGGVYEGDYINNIKEGHGLFKWNPTKSYDGEFKRGRPCGRGILKSRGLTYDAVFNDGKVVSKTLINEPES